MIKSRRPGLIAPDELHAALRAAHPIRLVHICSAEQFELCHLQETSTALSVHAPELWEYLVCEEWNGLDDFIGEMAAVFSKCHITGAEALVFVEPAFDAGRGQSFRGWLLARIAGYDADKLFVLDGGAARWRALGLPVAAGAPAERTLGPEPDLRLDTAHLATRSEVVEVACGRRPGTVILDVRDPLEWAGDWPDPLNERVDISPGRIPGSIHFDWKLALARPELPGASGPPPAVLAGEAALREAIEPLQIDLDTPILLACYKSARAAVVLFVLRELGHTNVRVYLEGWHGFAKNERSVPFETSGALPSATRAFGATRELLARMHRQAARAQDRAVASERDPGGYEVVDASRLRHLAERHQWLTGPLFRASNHVRHTPFFQWLAQIQTPAELREPAMNLWHHSATFPQVMGAMLAGTTLCEHRRMGHYARHLIEEVEHHNWLADWLRQHGLITEDSELWGFVPTFETSACAEVGWRLVRRGDAELWMVVLNSSIERLSNDLFKVLAPRMREIGAGHRYFDVHVGADEFHSIMGLEHVEPQDPASPRGRELILWALQGVASWCNMLHSWIGHPYRVQLSITGHPVQPEARRPGGVIWPSRSAC